MDNRPRAYMVHRTSDRMRIKVPGRRRDAIFFAALQRRLLQLDGVDGVEINSLTASVLIRHDGTVDPADLDSFGWRLDTRTAPAIDRQSCREQGSGSDCRGRATRGGDSGVASVLLKMVLTAVSRQLAPPVVELALEVVLNAAMRSVNSPLRIAGGAAPVSHPPRLLAA
jgi:hypothetical protein